MNFPVNPAIEIHVSQLKSLATRAQSFKNYLLWKAKKISPSFSIERRTIGFPHQQFLVDIGDEGRSENYEEVRELANRLISWHMLFDMYFKELLQYCSLEVDLNTAVREAFDINGMPLIFNEVTGLWHNAEVNMRLEVPARLV